MEVICYVTSIVLPTKMQVEMGEGGCSEWLEGQQGTFESEEQDGNSNSNRLRAGREDSEPWSSPSEVGS